MLNLRAEAMSNEIRAFSQRLRVLKNDLRERGKLSEATRTLLNQILQHKERLETKISNAERAGSWDSVKSKSQTTGTLLSSKCPPSKIGYMNSSSSDSLASSALAAKRTNFSSVEIVRMTTRLSVMQRFNSDLQAAPLPGRRFSSWLHFVLLTLLQLRLSVTEGRANLQVARFVIVLAVAAWLVVPSKADERPSDPFGNYTIDLNKDAPIAKMWDLLKYKMVIEKGYFHKCLVTNDCPSTPALAQTLDEIRQYQGKALVGHLNLSVNQMIKPAPAAWMSPLEAITMRNGDCKSYSMAKYAGAQELGIPADHVRIVIVHNRRHSEDHMITAVYQEGEWFLLDNLTNFLVKDSEKKDYEPLAVLDYKGVRRYLSAFWVD